MHTNRSSWHFLKSLMFWIFNAIYFSIRWWKFFSTYSFHASTAEIPFKKLENFGIFFLVSNFWIYFEQFVFFFKIGVRAVQIIHNLFDCAITFEKIDFVTNDDYFQDFFSKTNSDVCDFQIFDCKVISIFFQFILHSRGSFFIHIFFVVCQHFRIRQFINFFVFSKTNTIDDDLTMSGIDKSNESFLSLSSSFSKLSFSSNESFSSFFTKNKTFSKRADFFFIFFFDDSIEFAKFW